MNARQVAVAAMADLDAARGVVCSRLPAAPRYPAPAMFAALEALPVTLVQHGAGYDEAEAHALALAGAGATYVSSYNDTGVIAGQSTIGRELDAQLPGPPTVACPLGGGGLSSGLGLWAAGRPQARVVAVESERSPG